MTFIFYINFGFRHWKWYICIYGIYNGYMFTRDQGLALTAEANVINMIIKRKNHHYECKS